MDISTVCREKIIKILLQFILANELNIFNFLVNELKTLHRDSLVMFKKFNMSQQCALAAQARLDGAQSNQVQWKCLKVRGSGTR